MFTRSCEVQIDGASYEHFKYKWSTWATPRLSTLKSILIQRLNNKDLFGRNSKYDLFATGQYGRRIFDNNRALIPNEKFALKTKDGKTFYAQAIGNDVHSELIDQLKKDTEQLQNEINQQIKFRKQQTLNDESLRKEIKEQMEKEYNKINNNLNINITKESIESSYKIILTQKCNFDEKKTIIMAVHKKYQKLYKKVKKEYDRIRDKHFEELKDPNIKQLILLGKTGDGKSTFGNRLCADKSTVGNEGPFKSTNDPQSVTQEITKSLTEIGCDRISVVDTPGAFDSAGPTADWEHAQDLVKYLKGSGGINAFIVICKPPRLDGTFLQYLKNLTIMLGREVWDYIIFVVTHLKINCKNKNEDVNIEEKKEESESESDDDDDGKTPQEWLREFALLVRGKFDLPANQPYCIGVENRNRTSYESAIEELMNTMKQEKFECDRIKSPFDDKKKELQTLFDEMQAGLDSIVQIRTTMKIIENTIKDQILEVQDYDSQYQPRFGSLNVASMTQIQAIDFMDVEMIDREIIERKEEEVEMGTSFVMIDDQKGNDRHFIDNRIVRSSNVDGIIGISDDNEMDMDLEQDPGINHKGLELPKITTFIDGNGVDMISHFITPTTITHESVEIKLWLKQPTLETVSFCVMQCGKEGDVIAAFTIETGQNQDVEELLLDGIENKSAFTIALYQDENEMHPISNQLQLSIPDKARVNEMEEANPITDENYKPDPVLLSTIRAFEENEHIFIFYDTPQQLHGDEIAFKMKYIDDNKDDDYISNPLILPKLVIPISFQIITSSTIDDIEYLSNASDIITIGYKRKPQQEMPNKPHLYAAPLIKENIKSHSVEPQPEIPMDAVANKQAVDEDEEQLQDDELVNYLRDIGFEEYLDNFRNNGFESLEDLKEEANDMESQDLKEMGIMKLAHRKRLLRALHQMKYKDAVAKGNDNDNQAKEGAPTAFF